MITFKTLTLEDLKKDYSERKGFVFQAGQRSSDEAIENLCNVLIEHAITPEFPEFVTRLNDNTIVFVYNIFDMPTFIKDSMAAIKMGVCKVETLYNVLKQN